MATVAQDSVHFGKWVDWGKLPHPSSSYRIILTLSREGTSPGLDHYAAQYPGRLLDRISRPLYTLGWKSALEHTLLCYSSAEIDNPCSGRTPPPAAGLTSERPGRYRYHFGNHKAYIPLEIQDRFSHSQVAAGSFHCDYQLDWLLCCRHLLLQSCACGKSSSSESRHLWMDDYRAIRPTGYASSRGCSNNKRNVRLRPQIRQNWNGLHSILLCE